MTDFIAAAPYRSGAHFEQGWSVVSDHFGIVAYGVTQEAAEWVANRLNDMAARFAGDGHGPGSRRDKDKALLQLEACFSAYPMATGYSHLTALILRDTNEGLRATAEAGGAPTPATLRAPINAEFVARRFHHWYETFAPKFGYTTRRETACPFDALPSANRDLMVATCEAVVRDIAPLFAAQESTQTTLLAPEVAFVLCNNDSVELVYDDGAVARREANARQDKANAEAHNRREVPQAFWHVHEVRRAAPTGLRPSSGGDR